MEIPENLGHVIHVLSLKNLKVKHCSAYSGDEPVFVITDGNIDFDRFYWEFGKALEEQSDKTKNTLSKFF